MTTSTSKVEPHTGEKTRFGFELDFSPETLLQRWVGKLTDFEEYYEIFGETRDPANWIFRFELIFNDLVTKLRETSQHQTPKAFKDHQRVAAYFDRFAWSLARGELTTLPFARTSHFLSWSTPPSEFFSKDSEGDKQLDFSDNWKWFQLDFTDNWKRLQFYSEYRKYWLERGKLWELKGKDPFEHYSRLREDHGRLYVRLTLDNAFFWDGIWKIINFIPWAIVSHRDRTKPLIEVNPLLWENRIFSLGLDKMFQSEKKKAQQTEEEVIQSACLLGSNFWTHHQFNKEEPYVKSALYRLSKMQEEGTSPEMYRPAKHYFYPLTPEIFKKMYLETKKDLDDIIND